MKYRLILLFHVVAAAGLAQYTWDYTKTPVVPDSTRWNENGSYGFTGSGVSFPGAGGSLISIPGIPITNPTTNLSEPGTTSPDYDVVSTLTLGSGGGTWIQFLRANSNTVKSGSGTYVSVELVVPSGFTSPGAATLNIKQCVNGTLSSLGSVVLTAGDGMTLRTAIFGSSIFIFENKWLVWESGNVTVTSGNPGIGGYNMPSGTGFTSISLGHHDVLPPAQISATSFESSVFPNSVSLRWQGVLDDPNGVGVFQYWFARNGVGLTFLGAPEMTDAAVQPSTTYTYTVYAGDYDGNYGPGTSFTVTTPPAGAIDPRRTGISSTGSYWGGAGEQIDTLSGNLNFSIPLLTAQGRTGWTVPVSLVYNSQNWRSDNGVNWDLGDDVGFGYGWQMLIGSVVPFYTAYSGYPPDHYLYTDATGAQYRLDQNNGGVWTSSTQSVYVWLDTRVSPYRLHFPDGKFWVLGSTSGGEEPDGGSMYPTIIQDTFGNQVIVTYDTGLGLPFSETTSPQTWVVTQNTSSRIISIEDARAIFCDNAQNAIIPCNWNSGSTIGYTSYAFSYNRTGYSTPHLASYTNFIGTPELATGFTYTVVSQEPPFGADPHFGASVNLLTQVTIGATAPYVFGYDAGGAGEMTSAILPYGAELSWNYSSFEYIGTRSLREVSDRYLAPDALHATNPLWTYVITHPDAPNSVTVHSSTKVIDPSGVGVKTWNFTTAGSAWQLGLISQITQAVTAAGTPLQSDTYTWSQDPVGRPYISAKTSSIGQGTSNPQTRYSTQTLDQYGNVTQSVVYPYYNGTRGSAIRTYVNTYLSASNYTSNFIFNRLSTTTLDAGQGPFTIQSNQYDTAGCATAADGQSVCGGWTGAPTGPGREIGAGLPAGSQGALITSIGVKGSGITYYHWGTVASVNNDDGTASTASADSLTNYAAPQSITVQNYNQTLSYSPWLGVTQTTGANGEQLQMTYDSYGRPSTATSPYGAVTNYAYQSASAGPPFWQSKTGPEGYTLTTLDGLGRVASVQRGATSTSITSETDTTWMPYATAALGVVRQVSLPYMPGPSPSKYWTATTYDALGRTLSVRKPDGASTTRYAYAGNQTTVTDPAGLWKQYTYDVLGNLVTVVEPDPLNQPGGTLTTTYTYDWMKHVTGVAMPRGATTQTRSFVYNNAGELTSATNPESGTTAYTYNPTGTLQNKLDANGQKTVYTYDAWNRVTNINYYYKLGASELPENYRSVSFSYDTNSSWLPGWAQNTWGRLTQVLYYMSPATGGGYLASMQEAYSYTPSGAITKKAYGCGNGCHNLEFDWAYNTAGQISSVTYPVTNNSVLTNAEILTWGYDSMGRPVSLTSNNGPADVMKNMQNDFTAPAPIVQNVQYDYAGRMTSLQYLAGETSTGVGVYTQESMSYNVSGQLASLGWGNPAGQSASNYSAIGAPTGGVGYTWSSTQNNGQITQAVDTISGETITYIYDALKRLTAASSTKPWTQTFQYDGFGNLTAKVLNGASTPIPVNPANNRLSNATYDADGNMTSGAGASMAYDEANRLTSAAETSGGIEYYGYSPDNKRVYHQLANGTGEWIFYSPQGERMGIYTFNSSTGWSTVSTNVWFAGKLMSDENGAVFQDRLGTNRASGARFYPYGDEVASTANDHEKFATYTRDSYTGLDYADQRFYASTYGRFDTTDPGYAGALSNPQSLNLYSYVLGDPVNGRDPQGLCSAIGGGGTESAYEAGTNAEQEFASEVGGIAIFPYSNGTYLGGYLNVALQGRDVPTGATLNWFIGLTIAAQTPGPISAYAFSGSAGAFTLAYNLLPSDIQSRITNITYIDPGSNGEPLTSGTPGTNVTVYSDNSDLANILVQLLGSGPGGNVTTVDTGACGHNSNCVYSNFAEQISRTATSCDVGAGAVIGLPQRNYYTSSGGFDWSNFYWNPAPVPVVTETIHYDSL